MLNNLSAAQIPALPDTWREWVAINLMQNAPASDLAIILKNNGFNPMVIAHELNQAQNDPYINAGKQLAHILEKRDWLLSACDSLARMDKSYQAQIDVIETPSFDYFIKHYYSKHRPVLLKNGIAHWTALQKWRPSYFAEKLGEEMVELQFDREADTNFELNALKLTKPMKMKDFVALLESNQPSNNYYMTARNTASSMQSLKPIFEDIGDFGQGYRQNNTDGTFFWMGPQGTFTPLHHDLTNNMLVQVYGSKKVTLIPALQAPSVYNHHHVFSATDFPNMDFEKFPLLREVTPIEIQINAGDAIFIPIAWWHCVESLSTSISISFTNFNAPNNQGENFPSK